MKRLVSGNDNRIKRRISAVMAAVIIITTICSVTYFKEKRVEARETVYSMEKVLNELSSNNAAFKILEIVPDNVSANISVQDVSGNFVDITVSQNMGFLGYYVGGSEPIRKDVAKVANEVEQSSLRYNIVSELYNALRQSNVYKEDGPFVITDEYKELRQGEVIRDGSASRVVSDKELEAGVNNNTWHLIERSKDKSYTDISRGTMERIDPSLGYAHFTIDYDYDNAVSLADSVSEDAARVFMKGYKTYSQEISASEGDIDYDEDDNFYIGTVDDKQGISQYGWAFDPLLVYNDIDDIEDIAKEEKQNVESSVSGNVFGEADIRAIFEYAGNSEDDDMTSGYISLATPVDADSELEDGIPIYVVDPESDKLVYYKPFSEVKKELSGDGSAPTESENSVSDDNISTEEHNNTIVFSSGTTVGVLNELDLDGSTNKTRSGDELIENEDNLSNDEGNSDDNALIDNGDDSIKNDDSRDSEDNLFEDETDNNEPVENKEGDNIDIVISEEFKNGTAENETGYYTVRFEYLDISNDIDIDDINDEIIDFYRVKDFIFTDKENGAEYMLPYVGSVLLPAHNGDGLIAVKDNAYKDYFVFEYNEDTLKCDFCWHGDENSKEYFRIKNAGIYYRCSIENREWFKRFVFDRDCSPYDSGTDTGKNLKLSVTTKCASDVQVGDIDGTDNNNDFNYRMIALVAGDASFCLGDENGYYKYSAGSKDISPEVYTRLLHRIGMNRSPVIVDYRIITDDERLSEKYKDSLAFNAATALMMEDVKEYGLYVENRSKEIVSGHIKNTKYDPQEFRRTRGIAILEKNKCHYVNHNVYIYNRTKTNDGATSPVNLLNLTFNSKDDFDSNDIDTGFLEVKQDFESDKNYRMADINLLDKPSPNYDITEATVIRYIIGYGNSRVTEGKGEVNILELEPVNCFDLAVKYTDENNVILTAEAVDEKIKQDSNDFYGELYNKTKDDGDKNRSFVKQKGLKISLKQMTTAEFVGRIEDLNASYDMIYIGMNTGETKEESSSGFVLDENPSNWELVDTIVLKNGDGFYDPYREWSNWNIYGNLIKSDVPTPDIYEYKDDPYNRYHCNYCQSKHGNYYYIGYQPWNNNPGRDTTDHIIKKFAMGHKVTTTEMADTYGGYHHKIATQDDVIKNHALARDLGQPITDFNDDNMDGLVYCNVGDMAYISDTCAGSLRINEGTKESPSFRYVEMSDESKSNADSSNPVKGASKVSFSSTDDVSLYRTRYSGNDITKENCKAIQDFAKAGYPIILADGFYKDYDEKTRYGSINECAVDNSSYMYEAVDAIMPSDSNKLNNVFKQSFVPKEVFNWFLLNLGKPTIEMEDGTLSQKAQTDPQEITEKSGDGYYYATFNFTIDSKGSGTASSKYTTALYIDINADGKYSKSNEGIMFSDIRDKAYLSIINPSGFDEYGLPVYELEPGKSYIGRCKLSTSFVGCLPWRICVSQTDNAYRRATADGFYYIKNKERHVKVLQIKSRDGGDNWDMASTSNELFQEKINSSLVPFTIDITSMTGTELANHSSVKRKTVDGYYEYLKDNYQMIIMGYKDMYEAPDRTVTEAIKKYIEDGYSVLFTHDCTSFNNAKSDRTSDGKERGANPNNWWGGVAKWGFEFNDIIRNLVGMDRYDVLYESKHENEKPYKPRSNRETILEYEKHGFTYSQINYYGYQDSKGTDGRSSQKMQAGLNDEVNSKKLKYSNLVGISIGEPYNDNNDIKNSVSQVNKGQITQYPYKIPERFKIASTHAQYYQLDFTADDDNDGESDIVVWYCISSTDSNTEDNMYRISPNDVRNNYYIYNKGNVTYSGVGHSTVTDPEEMELFVNTMVAAYRSGLHAPDLNVVESFDSNKNTRQLYVSYDDQIQKIVSANAADPDLDGLNKNSDIDNYVDFYFNAQQVSLVQNASSVDHNLYARVFIEDSPTSPPSKTLQFEHVDSNGNYAYNRSSSSVSRNFIKGDYRRVGNSYVKVTDGGDGEYALDDDGVFVKCEYRQIRQFEEGTVDTANTNVKEVPLYWTDEDTNNISQKNGAAIEIMNEDKVNETFKEDSFSSASEYQKFTDLKSNIIDCAKIKSGVTYKVRIPVDNNMLNIWGGIDKSGINVLNNKKVYVIVMDFSSYRNNQISNEDADPVSTEGEGATESTSTITKKGKIYKVEMTKWRAASVNLSRVEVFNLD